MAQYGNFAYIYDQLMDDVDYEKWVDHIENLIKLNNIKVKNILELACGTGNITIPLTRRGYDIAGIDISEEMLDVAYNKSIEENTTLVLLEQDIVELDFDIYDLDCVLCACDGFNYITSIEDLDKVFTKVHQQLKDGGIFVFDISSHFKLKNILGNNFMGQSRKDLSYMWTNYYDDQIQLLEMELDFFVKIDADDDEEDNLYEKYSEVHLQRAHKEEEIIKLLEKVGFEDIKSFGDFELENVKEDSQRVFFTAIK
ncbi:class I SAM-dependent DNA methyltransferase [Peptostreptococcus equinus]|uniref:Methyltransferase domain-containing protein n=1 Tax=Peptostreptococcus equinus TaxID=3003601 RepID=A0ABY7JLY9_9FIRM|nr:class I SAM-dependent methyltransferase [Peptostreptococcus sp. CBA3647]WAW14381.1 methyltransferase domain-containing protein [Peptostreptococcus sp. CBA3647]